MLQQNMILFLTQPENARSTICSKKVTSQLMTTRAIAFLFVLFCSPLMTHCSTSIPVTPTDLIRLNETTYTSFDGDQFGYRKWLPKGESKLVIVGVHGISGASLDYKPLATQVLKTLPNTAVYAAETRGQGNDPIKERRGHIRNPKNWFRDLLSFTELVRKKHPKAKIVWCGESMGSLIALHTCRYAQTQDVRSCDALVLSSPITDIRGDFPRWKEKLAHGVAVLFPTLRVSLETLSGAENTKVTRDSVHQEQVAENPYHIKRHTLRLLSVLGKMIRSARSTASYLRIPTLILHGGNDVFSAPEDVEKFEKEIPSKVSRKFYPESYHLLFYDHQSEKVIQDITLWLGQLR